METDIATSHSCTYYSLETRVLLFGLFNYSPSISGKTAAYARANELTHFPRDEPSPYLNGLEGAAEEHVVGGDQRTNGVVMGTNGVDFLQGLDIPHLRKNAQHTRALKRKEGHHFVCSTGKQRGQILLTMMVQSAEPL